MKFCTEPGFPAKYVQHNIPISSEEQDLQRRRAYGDTSITDEILDAAWARTLREYLRGREQEASEVQVKIMVKFFGEKWNKL